jgi:hypothetical protein
MSSAIGSKNDERRFPAEVVSHDAVTAYNALPPPSRTAHQKENKTLKFYLRFALFVFWLINAVM